MTPDALTKRTFETGKTYSFNEKREDEPAQYWFQESDVGRVLFIVFYTKACRWSRCTSCNLPSLMSKNPVSLKNQLKQIDWIFSRKDIIERFDEIKKVIVSNNGSVLDEDTFCRTSLIYFIARCNQHLGNLGYLTLETRSEYSDLAALDFLAQVLKEGDVETHLELALGVEIYDDVVRNKVFHKGLPNSSIERFLERLKPYPYSVKMYFMQKPLATMSDAEAIEDIVNGIEYLSELKERYGVPIHMHLNPTYGATGTPLEVAFKNGTWTPPRLEDVTQAIKEGLQRSRTPVKIFVGLYDEGLATPGGSFMDHPKAKEQIEKLELWNRTQDIASLG